MITLLMLPFLLLIRMSVDDNSWFYGPEYTYNAHVTASNTNEQTGHKHKVFDMSGTLKCRPRVPDTLSCRFDNLDIRCFHFALVNFGQDSITLWDINEEPFEVIFDRFGVKELVVGKSMPPWVVDRLWLIVNQLNFGFDMRHKHEGTFTTMEKSYMGECETVVKITRKPMPDDGLWNDALFEISAMPGFKKTPGEVVEIKKWRNLHECINKADYFFGSKNDLPTVYGSTLINLMSSTSDIVISDTNFTSFTSHEILLKNENTGKDVKLHEMIVLKLESIAPDNNAYQPIERPSAINFFSFKHGGQEKIA